MSQLPHRIARELITTRVADAEQRRLGRRAARTGARRTGSRRTD